MAAYALPGIFVMGCLVYLMESYVIRCPEQSEWNIRAEIQCQNITKYFCLYNYIHYTYEEGCTGPEWDISGRKRVYSRNFNTAPCRDTRYQPIRFVTNGNSDCIFRKSLCTEEGQTLFSNGTTRTDSTCRCDYTQGYAFVTVPRSKCYCRPSEEDCSCYLKKCQGIGYNLSADYECTKNITNNTDCPSMSANPYEDPHIDMVPRKEDLYVIKRTCDVAILVSICFFVVIVIAMCIMLQQRLLRCPCLSTEQGNNPQTTPGSTSIHSIASLRPNQNRWQIRARVTWKSDVRTWSNSHGEGKFFNVDLSDESGKIRATGFNDSVDKYHEMMEVNKIYFVSKGTLKAANKQYNNISNDYEMTFNADTTVELCNEDFTKINELDSNTPGNIVGNNPQTTPDSTIIHAIASLTPNQNRWRIRARVTQKSDIIPWKYINGEGKLFSVNLLDKSGEIKATGFNDAVDKYYEMLEVNKIYFVSKGTVQMAKKEYTNLSNDYEIKFKADTTVELCNEDDDLPSVKFDFTKINELDNKTAGNIVDLIGVVKSFGDVGTVISKTSQKEKTKRVLQLCDQSGMVVNVTLWGSDALSFEGSSNPVLAVKGVKLSDYGGRSASLLASSLMLINPDIREAHLLREWYDRKGQLLDFQIYCSGGVRTE